jgi:hypothetical protein
MAICEKCGKNIGILETLNLSPKEMDNNLCRECYKTSIKDLEYQKFEEERHQQCKEIKKIKQIRKKLANGGKVVLYKNIYTAVDSTINKEKLADRFDISLIQEAALNGWEIVNTVSKTKGISNWVIGSDGAAWGMGGNVEGVYFIMRKEITAIELPLSDDELMDCFMG